MAIGNSRFDPSTVARAYAKVVADDGKLDCWNPWQGILLELTA